MLYSSCLGTEKWMTNDTKTTTGQKEPSFLSILYITNTLKKIPSQFLSTIRNIIIPLGARPEAWDFFLNKTVQYNTQHQFLTGCLLMVAFYTYPIVLMSMYAHMRSLIIMKDLPMIYAFSINMVVVILCKESIEASFNFFWGHFTNHMISFWSQEQDGNKKMSSIMDYGKDSNAKSNENSGKDSKDSSDDKEARMDNRGDIKRFCNSFIQLIKNGISRASRIALALIYLLPRTSLPTIGIFFTSSMVFYKLINKLNHVVTAMKKDYNNVNNEYFKLQNESKSNKSQLLSSPVRFLNHQDTINENNVKVLTIQSSMLLPSILINYLNSLVQNILAITLPVILLTQDIHFEQGALEQAKEAFLRIFLGIDPLSKDADTLSTFSESFDQVQEKDREKIGKLDNAEVTSPNNSSHCKTKEKSTHATLITYLHAFVHATKISSLYTIILSLLHHSILFTLSNPSSHIFQAIISLSWCNTLFLKLTATWALCFCFELLSEQKPNIKNEINHTTNFALAATFTLSLLSTISFPILLANPTILYPGIIALSGISTLTCVKFFKYETKIYAVEEQPRILPTAPATHPSCKKDPLVCTKIGDELTLEMTNLKCQWEKDGVKCDINAHTYKEGCSYLHYGSSGAGKSNALQITYQSFVYYTLANKENYEDLNRQILGKYGIEESFSKPDEYPLILKTVKKGVKTIPILITQKASTQNITPPTIPSKLKNLLTEYFKTQTLSDLQEFVYNEIITTDSLPDSIAQDDNALQEQTQFYPELKLLQSWPDIHDSMIEFIGKIYEKNDKENIVIQAIVNQDLSLLKSAHDKSFRTMLTGGSSSGGQKGLIRAAFCYALLKLRLPSFQFCLMLDEPFSETGDKRGKIFELLNEAVTGGDQNSINKPMLHIVAHHLSASDINCFTHKIEYPEAIVKPVNCNDSTFDHQSDVSDTDNAPKLA